MFISQELSVCEGGVCGWVGWVGARGFKTCLPSDNKDGQGEVDLRGVSGYAVSLGGGLLTKSVDVGHKQTVLCFTLEQANC